jgi:hypothetical protein
VYATLTRAKTSDEPIANAAIVAEEMERWLRDVEGFQGFLMLSREGTSVGVTFWESREAAERQQPLRRQFVDRVLTVAGVEIEEIVDYDVTFSRLGPPLLADFTR